MLVQLNLLLLIVKIFFNLRAFFFMLLVFLVIAETQSCDKNLLVLVDQNVYQDIDTGVFSEWTQQLQKENWIVKVMLADRENKKDPRALKEYINLHREPGDYSGVILLGSFPILFFKHGNWRGERLVSDLWYICDDPEFLIKKIDQYYWVTIIPAFKPLPQPACWVSRIDFYTPGENQGKYINTYLKTNTEYRKRDPVVSGSPVFMPTRVEPLQYPVFARCLNSNNNRAEPERVMVLIRSPSYIQCHAIENTCVAVALLNEFERRQTTTRSILKNLMSNACPQVYGYYDRYREAYLDPVRLFSSDDKLKLAILTSPLTISAAMGSTVLHKLSEWDVPVLGDMSKSVLDACPDPRQILSSSHNILPVVVGDATLSTAFLSEIKP